MTTLSLIQRGSSYVTRRIVLLKAHPVQFGVDCIMFGEQKAATTPTRIAREAAVL
jgi:hypothetical protein